MRCPECAERNSVAARKCEFCGNSFKKKPLSLGLKLAVGGVAVAVTASIAASYVVPNLVDPERNLGRAAKQLANGPKSLEHAGHIKKEFSGAVKDFLKTSGGDKASVLTASLQKLLPSSAFEVHVIELPRGLRVVEIDTLLQATGYLVMKTSSGTKVFDLPGFEVFDDARILNDSAGPVLALLGHTGGPPPHKPIVRTYALLPDYVHDESDKLVPPLKVDGTAKFAKNGHDVNIEFNLPANRGRKSSERLAYGMLKWKDARYVSDFGGSAALIAATQAADAPKQAQVVAPTPEKIVVRSFTAADAARATTKVSAPSVSAVREAARTVMTSDSVLAAVPTAAPTINNLKSTIQSVEAEFGSRNSKRRNRDRERSEAKQSTSTGSSARRTAEVICAGATLRARPARGSASMNNFGRGTTVSVLSKDGDWCRVRVNGQEGYIYSSLLKEGGSPQVQVGSASPAPASGRRRRSRRSDEHMLIADATPRKRSGQRERNAAPVEPMLVP